MPLLYLAVAYVVGILAGRWAWEAGLFGCAEFAWVWPLPLLGLFPAYALHTQFKAKMARASAVVETMRWPAWAGFEPPGAAVGLLRSPGVWTAMALCCCLGGLRYAVQPITPCLEPTDLGYWVLPADQAFVRNAPQVTLDGVITGYPVAADRRQRMYVDVHRLYRHDVRALTTGQTDSGLPDPDEGLPVSGRLRLNTDLRQTFAYGQPVRVRGRLVQPPEFEDFSYREYLAIRGVHSVVYDARVEVLPEPKAGASWRSGLYGLRRRGELFINRTLPEPYAALANGMLLGIETGIPDTVYALFNQTGTSHVIVISGANVAVVIAVILGASNAVLGRRRALWVAVGAVGAYAVLVGGDASVTRAALMGSLGACALSLNRRSAALIALAAAGWIMALFNPSVLWDVSFQLSATATAGLILFTPVFNRGLTWLIPGFRPGPLLGSTEPGLGQRTLGLARGLLQDGLVVTVAANLTVTPLLLFHFDRLSLTTLPANLLIAPVQPYIMIWGMAGVLLGLIGATTLGAYLLWIPWLCLTWTWAVVQWFAGWEGDGLVWHGYGIAHTLALYLAIGLVWAAAHGKTTAILAGLARLRPTRDTLATLHPTGMTALGVLVVANLLVWRMAFTQPDGYLHVHFLDVGQGDGIFLQTPNGRQVLVDGGISPQQLRMQLAQVMPFWDRTLDMLVLTHPDSDHMDAQIEIPARYTVSYALDTEAGQNNPQGERWRAAIEAAQVTVARQHAGGWIDLGDGIALWVLWPPDGGYIGPDGSNENSLVLKLVYGNFSALLTGDAGLPSEMDLLRARAPLSATVLKVGHHGSRTSTARPFVEAVAPWLAVIQVGENRYGHPHPEVLENLRDRTLLRNDRHGRIHLWTDGTHLWLNTER